MKKTLVISYSHTGQTETAVASFASGLQQNLECDFVTIKSKEKFAFPWKMRDFFRAFPRCVQGLAPEVEAIDICWQDYDFVILAYQVWFLSPSLPVQGFLKSPSAKNLQGKKVVTLVTCRNLWQSAFLTVRRYLTNLGAQHLGQITLCETSPAWATFVTTPRWLLTGKKGAFWFFPAAGIRSEDFTKLKRKGEVLGLSWRQSAGQNLTDTEFGANLNSVSLAQMESIGFQFFRAWSTVILKISRNPGSLQDFLLFLFRVNLILLILILIPCTKIFELLVGNNPKYSLSRIQAST